MMETVQLPPPPPSSPFFKFTKYAVLNPSKTHKTQFTLFLLVLLTTAKVAAATGPEAITSSNFRAYYAKHCNNVVPESPLTGAHVDLPLGEEKILFFDTDYLTGGHPILPERPVGYSPPSSVSLYFVPNRHEISPTQNPNLVSIEGTLRLRLPRFSNLTWGRNLKQIRFRAPRFPVRPRSLRFQLYGFWSMNDGKLCMVGSGLSYKNSGAVSSLSVVFKVNHPVNFSNVSSLIRGVLESMDDQSSFNYFEPVSMLAIPHFGEYKYTLIDKVNGNVCLSGNGGGGAGAGGENENLVLELADPNMCLTQLYGYTSSLELEYGSDCGNKCNPLGESFGSLPKFMMIQGISCDYGSGIRVLIRFSNSRYNGYGRFGYDRVFDPSTMLIGEGAWDEKKNRLCVVACRVLNSKDSLANAYVGDCSTRLSLRFPRTLTIKHRSTVVGQLSSNKTVNDTGYFSGIGFHSSVNDLRGPPGLKYEYTMLDRINKFCPKKRTAKGKGKTYPNIYSSDMRFEMSIRNGKGQTAEGYATPLFVGNQIYGPYQMGNNHSGLLNVGYKLSFTTPSDFNLGDKLLSNELVEISAEGRYDNETGLLCMIGCWNLTSHINNPTQNYSVDCEILINVQFSPLDAKGGGKIKGTIESMHGNSDPLYFGQLDMTSNSIYTTQAAKSIWRMDIEITMVLISNTFACVFLGLQLYHVKKHPNVLPFISFVMLLVLTLGHMIPLVLNFEALFLANRNRQNVFLESGGWLEVNEVAVRVITMVAFLLQFRLVQLTWSARQGDGSHKSVWVSEKKVLCLSLPLYIGGALIAWYVSQWKNSYGSPYLHPRHRWRHQQHYHWRDLKSYAGLILDGFLLPQIMFNLFLKSKENPLTSSFYVGTSIVRSLPHVYDLYRAHSSTQYLDLSYIYANHRHDFYSTAWDIIIPLGGLLFAVVIYLQQRFGGCCILPKRFREASQYEKVPVVGSEEQQAEASH